MARKTWNEKLHTNKDNRYPVVEDISDNPKAVERFGGTKMLIAPATDYDRLMKSIPQGKLITVPLIREKLARDHSADFTCPLTAGIFTNIVANASDERAGIEETPYWRTLKRDGELCEKFPGGLEGHKALLESEGHTVTQRGKRMFVTDFEESLFGL
jgi:hypothetical protein